MDVPDLSDPALYQKDAWRPIFERVRQEAPVHLTPESAYGPYWSVTRFKDIIQVEVDHRTFSSEEGFSITDLPPPEERTPSFIRMDPPTHTLHRKTVAPIFAPSVMASMEDGIRRRTAEVLDALPHGETFDWVERVSIELTTAMLTVLFDFPWEERRKLTYWSDVAITNFDAPDALVRSREEQMQELGKMAERFAGLWEERANAPPKLDLISMMAHSESTKDLTTPERIGTLALLIVGGNDTTRNTMSSSVLAFDESPDELEKLKADPAKYMPKFVPEMIRYATPVIHMRRTTTAEVEVGGQTIPKGAKVIMWYVSGNFDDEELDRPERFDLDREKPRRHLAFGAGIHRCVGDRLAELQLKVLWEEILARQFAIQVMGPPERVYSNFLRGVRALPVRVKA